MPDSASIEDDFLREITALVDKNLSSEQFGVTELADQMNMSRSNLLRKVKKSTNLSVSQLISQIRLERAMELLRTSQLNVSEVSHQVGFSSTSYFIKCFREHYGYPPGEVGEHDNKTPLDPPTPVKTPKSRVGLMLGLAAGLLITLALSVLWYYRWHVAGLRPQEKSIAVLPFKNDSSDSSNLYLINGLMESTLNNLQKIKDLKVISRTSSEKYRTTTRTIPEMAKELNVYYFVEGSGQKMGNHILLNIQLIEGPTDRHLWARQYRREVKDIFELQQEIAKDIAEEIEVIITPEEEIRIKKKPTEDLVAYDLLLKGNASFDKATTEGLEKAIPYYKQAIERDPKFAMAYAEAAMVYYYLDLFQAEKKHGEEMDSYADKALLYDAKLPESLVAKAMVYMVKKEYESAVPYLEKALEYNPNSVLVIQFLSGLYNLNIPNAPKYLEYALKGLRLDLDSYDSVTTSYTYLHVSNALMQTGFIDEALRYADKSLEYNPKNAFTGYLRVFILYARDRDLVKTRDLIMKEYNKDTTRIDVMMEVGEVYYQMNDYKKAYRYFKKFIEIRDRQKLEIFRNEDINMAQVYATLGLTKESEELLGSFKDFADHDQTIYKHMHQAMFYAYRKDKAKAIEHLKLFSKEDNYQYWVILFANSPIVESIRDLPEFKKTMQDIETKFWKRHNAVKQRLEEKGLL